MAPIVVAASCAAVFRPFAVRSSQALILPERELRPSWGGTRGSGVGRMSECPGYSIFRLCSLLIQVIETVYHDPNATFVSSDHLEVKKSVYTVYA